MRLRSLAAALTRPVTPHAPTPAVRAEARPAGPSDDFTPAARASRSTSRVTPADTALITAAYTASLNRAPTSDELTKSAALVSTLRAQGKTVDECTATLTFLIACTPEWQGRAAYQERLGRAPTAEELSKTITWGQQLQAEGKSVPEMRAAFDFVLAMTPEWQGRDAYQQRLGRAPTADELSKTITFGNELLAQGKTVEEMHAVFDFCLALTPEWQAKDAYQQRLGRAPTADEFSKTITWGRQLQAEGKTVPEMRAAFDFVLAMTPEWQAKDAYAVNLGRAPSADELSRMMAFGADLQGQGKSVEEMRAAFNYVIALTPEWQEAHRARLNINRDELYLQQPNGWTCGPTSLAMALAASGVRPANQDTVWELVSALGARAGVGTPGGVSLIADVARGFGVNAEANSSTNPADVRAALERGHGVVVNGDLGGGGHFLYLAGIDLAGNYIVCDPWRPGITSWNDGDLWAFTHHGNNPPGFAEIWPP